jgi:hypothetical protein
VIRLFQGCLPNLSETFELAAETVTANAEQLGNRWLDAAQFRLPATQRSYRTLWITMFRERGVSRGVPAAARGPDLSVTEMFRMGCAHPARTGINSPSYRLY